MKHVSRGSRRGSSIISRVLVKTERDEDVFPGPRKKKIREDSNTSIMYLRGCALWDATTADTVAGIFAVLTGMVTVRES